MANKIQFLRGLEANRLSVTPAAGEPLWTTDEKILYVGDGSTAGGIPVGGFTVSDGSNNTYIVGGGTVTFSDDNSFLRVSESSGTVTSTLFIETGATATSEALTATDEMIIKDVSDTTQDASGTMKSTTMSEISTFVLSGVTDNFNRFQTIAGDSGTDIVAANNNETVTFTGGTGISVATDDITNTVTITGHNIYSWDISDGTNTETIATGDQVVFAGTNTGTNAVTALTATYNTSNNTLTYDLDFDQLDTVYMPIGQDNWVDTTGDTMTGALTMSTGSSIVLNDNIVLNIGSGNDVKHHFNGTSYITELDGVNWIVRNIDDEALVTITHNADPALSQVDIAGNTIIAGNLTVQGTTTTVESTVVTISDPVFSLANQDPLATVDDGKDRGIEFQYYDPADVGNENKIGFFGWDNSTEKYVLLLNATNTAEVFTGTKAELDASVDATNILNAPWLETETQTLQDVTDLGATTSNAISITNATEADGAGTASFIVSGGAEFAKKVYVNSTTSASSSTTGALVIAGGIGVAENVVGAGAGTSSLDGFTIDAGTF